MSVVRCKAKALSRDSIVGSLTSVSVTIATFRYRGVLVSASDSGGATAPVSLRSFVVSLTSSFDWSCVHAHRSVAAKIEQHFAATLSLIRGLGAQIVTGILLR